MIVFLMFLGIALSIVQANGWFIVPDFCVVFCYVMSFFSWLISLFVGKRVLRETFKENKRSWR